MVVGILELRTLIRNAGEEDEWNVVGQQPFHMSMGQFCRITLGLAGDGFDTLFVKLMGRAWGEYHPVTQSGEKCEPERVVFIHIEDAGDTHKTSFGVSFCQRFVGEEAFIFISEQVRSRIFLLLFTKSALAAVAGDVAASAGEFVDGQTAVVGTAVAFGHGSGIFQSFHLLFAQHGSLLTFITLSGDQCSTECSHDTGDIRTDYFAVGDLLKASENGIVIEGSSLYHDVFSKGRSIGYFDNLEQRIFNNGVSKSGRDIIHTGAFLLCLLYTGVHKYGTAGSQIDGMLCEECCLCEILDRKVQGFCKGLDKGTAAGGTCLVELYIVNRMIFNTDTFHILTADIKDTVYIRVKELSGIVVGDGLHFAFIQHQSRFYQSLAVTGGAGADNVCFWRKLVEQILQCFQGNM